MTDEVRSDDLERVATQIAGVLGDAGMLVGGLAVGAWGYIRATDDIDFVAGIPADEVKERLESAGELSRGRPCGWSTSMGCCG
jgi:hypothetical protein